MVLSKVAAVVVCLDSSAPWPDRLQSSPESAASARESGVRIRTCLGTCITHACDSRSVLNRACDAG